MTDRIILRDQNVFEDDQQWNYGGLAKGCLDFNVYLLKLIGKYIGTSRAYRKDLIKRVRLEDEDLVSFRFIMTKVATKTSSIKYTISNPNGKEIVYSNQNSYKTLKELEEDFNFILNMCTDIENGVYDNVDNTDEATADSDNAGNTDKGTTDSQ